MQYRKEKITESEKKSITNSCVYKWKGRLKCDSNVYDPHCKAGVVKSRIFLESRTEWIETEEGRFVWTEA